MRGTRELYVRYASLRGWQWGAAKVAVVVALVVALAPFSVFGVNLVLTIAVVDAYVKRPVRDRRPLADVGLSPQRAGPGLAAGCAVGAALMASGVGVLWAAGWYEVTDVRSAAFVGAFAFAVVEYLQVSVFEEVLARGMLLRWVEDRAGTWVALAVSSLVFGIVHVFNPGATVVASLALAVEAGVLLGAAYVATRTLWVPIGIHWTWNLVQGSVFGAQVSGTTPRGWLVSSLDGPAAWTGGAFGPEGGLVLLTIGTLAGVWYATVAWRRREIVGFGGRRADPPARRDRPAGNDPGSAAP